MHENNNQFDTGEVVALLSHKKNAYIEAVLFARLNFKCRVIKIACELRKSGLF